MTRVYWRIFLAFWLVLVVTVLVTAGVNWVVFRDELAYTRADTLRDSLDALAEQAQRRLRGDGLEGLRDWLRDLQAGAPMPPLLIVGPDGRDILGRPTPPGFRLLRNLERDPASVDRDRRRMRGRFRPAIRRITDADGNPYLMLVPPFRPRTGDWFATSQLRVVFPVVLVLVSGLVCLLLARYLTRPIAVFRSAGRRIATGDLEARVGPVVARRKDEFGDLARDFDDMAGRVQQLVGNQQRLLRDVSHELRSPLARLQAAVGLLRQRGGDDPNLDRIEREIDVLDALIGQVLDYSRLQGQTSLQAERVDLVELVGGVVDDAAYEAAGRGLQFGFEPGPPEFVVADPGLLRSAIDNVVRNAVQHAKRTVTVRIVSAQTGGCVRISVSDDGPGAAPADLPQLFEPFFTSKSAQAGAGIGLSIARRAAELHGGAIAARNREAGGLVVTLDLPAAEAR